MTGPARVVIDLAGGRGGGAGRFREQYLDYAAGRSGPAGTAVGLDRHLTPPWLLRREVIAGRSDKVVAANNVGFVVAGREKWLLLRNANHFLTDEEWTRDRPLLGRSFGVKTAQVRAAALRADTVVVPSSSMAERVVAVLPSLARRVVVRFHPLRPPAAPGAGPARARTLVCPLVPSPYKHLDEHLRDLAAALPGGCDVVATMPRASAPPAVSADPRFSFLGVVPRQVVEHLYARAAAVFFPTAVESFGYPLAEARARGLPVLAAGTAHNREIAGGALVGYEVGDPGSLRTAIGSALTASPDPDPDPFDPTRYFDWLLAAR